VRECWVKTEAEDDMTLGAEGREKNSAGVRSGMEK